MADHLLLFFHIGFAIFTLGPLTAATMSTPRYIRRRDAAVVRYLHRVTQIYGVASLGIFLFGLLLAEGDLAQVWLSASMTLFIVALVLLLIVERDQRKAARLLEVAAAEQARAAVPAKTAAAKGGDGEEGTDAKADAEGGEKEPGARPAAADGDIAQVERGRLAALSGVVALIWLVILLLMVWNG